MIDYCGYYSRCFSDIPRFTKRIHFFDIDLEQRQFENMITDTDDSIFQNNYLGFTIVKPLHDFQEMPLIGRTVLRPYPSKNGPNTRCHITTPQKASIFGHDVIIESLPFMTQDIAVGACASTALWVAEYALNHKFGTNHDSLYTITEQASVPSIHTMDRRFPSKGLNTRQMGAIFNLNGLEVEIISTNNKMAKDVVLKEVVTSTIRTFVDAGIPVIANIKLSKSRLLKIDVDCAYHAVVISGYQINQSGEIVEIYVHDDQVGPYARINSKDGFFSWRYGNGEWESYDQIELLELMIPLYHKIRCPYTTVLEIPFSIANKSTVRIPPPVLYEVNDYKKWLLTREVIPHEEVSVNNKLKLLTKSFPKYLWVIRLGFPEFGQLYLDVIFDATLPFGYEVATFLSVDKSYIPPMVDNNA